MKKKFQCGSWCVEYTAEDGARLDRLRYEDFDLVTIAPKSFRPPTADYGAYEIRPVYGYDDCFPSVDSSPYPGMEWTVPDHGELCWLSWKVLEKEDRLVFSVSSKALPILFEREMHFTGTGIRWIFTVHNQGDTALPFQHVMHPLMPLCEVERVAMPAFEKVYDEINSSTLSLKNPQEVHEFLMRQAAGTKHMLFLQGIKSGRMSLTFRSGVRLDILFPVKYFPSIGIWWNNSAYPDEEGCRRNECAFEPIPGARSVLAEAYKEGSCLTVLPGIKFTWQIAWEMAC